MSLSLPPLELVDATLGSNGVVFDFTLIENDLPRTFFTSYPLHSLPSRSLRGVANCQQLEFRLFNITSSVLNAHPESTHYLAAASMLKSTFRRKAIYRNMPRKWARSSRKSAPPIILPIIFDFRSLALLRPDPFALVHLLSEAEVDRRLERTAFTTLPSQIKSLGASTFLRPSSLLELPDL